ncbi:hypothetical protein ACFVYE_42315 [Streptomyces sp. NPDC058239]|uniref:hypothetical protein n=1 Tax=Streptomyces sp. NPDC058239 TaxID=3346395 RepID=UPI0036E47739
MTARATPATPDHSRAAYTDIASVVRRPFRVHERRGYTAVGGVECSPTSPQRIAVRTPDKIEMPVEAVRASAAFSESDLGSYTLEYLKNEWYITD